jgi:hypothetical protein
MSDGAVHYYNVIEGKCLCGVPALADTKNFSVFPKDVTCAACLRLLKTKSGTPESE